LVGDILTGNYTYGDLEGDAEGASTFRWLRDGTPIAGATAQTYTLVTADVGTSITFEVTPVAATGTSPGTPAATTGLPVASGSAPTANAGPDQVVTDTDDNGTKEVTLDGSGSSDTDGTIDAYQWLEGDTEIATGATPTVTLGVGTHTLTLRVTDNDGLTGEDQVAITIESEDIEVEKESGDSLGGAVGETIGPFTIRVLNAEGNPIAGASVAWTVSPSDSGNPAASTTTTDQNGETSNNLTINQIGIVKLIATVQGKSVQFSVNSIADTPGLTQNQQELGSALDNAFIALIEKQDTPEGLTQPEEDLLNTINTLLTDDPSSIANALDRLLPEEVAVQGKASLEIARTQSTNVISRLSALRRGTVDANVSGLTVNYYGLSLPANILLDLFTGTASGGGAGNDDSVIPSQWGAFINGSISLGEKEATGNEAGFEFDTKGITMGVDYRFNDNFVAGGALGYGRHDSEYDGSSGNLDMTSWSLSAYGTYYHSDSVYVEGLLRYGMNDYENSRRINASGEPEQFGLGDTDGTELSFDISAGYELNRDSLTVTPYGRYGYTRLKIDSYTESASNSSGQGSGSVLTIGDQDVVSHTIALGGTLNYAISTTKGVFVPHLRFEWEHERNDDSRLISARFVHDPTDTVFRVETDDPDRNYFNLGAGLSAVFAEGRSGFIYYETRLGQDDVTLRSVNAGIRFEF
jgi:uncharacterized protein with beta-barrel porin domain